MSVKVRCLVAVVGAVAVITFAPAVAAAKEVLVLTSQFGATPLAAGTELDVLGEVSLLENGVQVYPHLLCELRLAGTLISNQAAKDEATLGSGQLECAPALTLSGFPWTMTMTRKLVGELKGNKKLGIALPGPCVYEGSKILGTFRLPFYQVGAGGVLRRNAHLSLGSCAKSLEVAMAFWPYSAAAGLIGAELQS